MKGKWSDYIFTVVVRFICGAIIGLLIGLILAFFGGRRGRLGVGRAHSTLVDLVEKGEYRTLFLWFGLAGFLGGLIAVFTIPRWQTPWYKSVLDDEHDKDDPAA